MAWKNTIEKIGWVVVILLVFVGLTSIVGRLYVVVGTMLDASFIESDPTSFDGRYNVNPVLTLSHLVPGFLFMLLGPFQFIKNVRAKWIQLHRWSGRVFIVSSLIAGVAALVVTVRLPVFGNLSALVGVTLFGTIFLFALLKAYFHIRKREIAQHREWMIRAFALGLGIATFRVQLIFLQSFTDYGFVEIWDTVAWFGFATNLIVAEIWINLSRGGVKNSKAQPQMELPSSLPQPSAQP